MWQQTETEEQGDRDRWATDLDGIRSQLRALLEGQRILAALEQLNARTRFRFTGVFRFEQPMLRTMALYDRENPALCCAGDTRPARESYCSLVKATGAACSIADSTTDARATDHPARDIVLSYLGVPLRFDDGRVMGTLCHYDTRPRIAPPGEVDVLGSVAPSVACWLAGQAD